jgi:hypothetical protein
MRPLALTTLSMLFAAMTASYFDWGSMSSARSQPASWSKSCGGCCGCGGAAPASTTVQDCRVTLWGQWSACTKDCGGGVQNRTRQIFAQPANGGLACPHALRETQACNNDTCAVPTSCVVTVWTQWSECSATCGGGHQNRSRTITTPAANGGTPCPQAMSETQACNSDPCPVNCALNDWPTQWSPCSKSCGSGVQSMSTTVKIQPANGGTPCPELTKTQPCNTQPCPVNCEVSGWHSGGCLAKQIAQECSGSQTQTRSVTVAAQNSGTACPALTQSVDCSTGCQEVSFDQTACNNSPCPDGWTPRNNIGSYTGQNGKPNLDQCLSKPNLGGPCNNPDNNNGGGSVAAFSAHSGKPAYTPDRKHGWALNCGVPWTACGVTWRTA